MKSTLIALLLFATSVFAEPSKQALDQIHADLSTFITEKNPSGTKAQIDAVVAELQTKIIARFPESANYTAAELESMSHNKDIVGDELLQSAYQQFKFQANGRPMPVIIECYKSKYDENSLNPMQKAIFYRLVVAMAKTTTGQKATAKPQSPHHDR